MMSLRGLECLVVTTEQGSLTKAATVLHLSQPALSHQIAAIERELGTAVIERLPRGIRPTAAGLAAVAEARVALAAAAKVVTAARRAAEGAGGRIRIACPETMTGWLLGPVLRDWQRRFPQVELALREYAGPDRMPDAAGDADIHVIPSPVTTGTTGTTGTAGTTAGAHAEVLGQEEIVVVASPGHRFAAMDAVPLAELAGERIVRYDQDDGSLPWLEEFTVGSPRTAACLAASGMGVAIVPVSALTPRPDGAIRSLDPPELRDIVVVVAAPHDALVRRFVADLRQRCHPPALGAPRHGQGAHAHRVDTADHPYPGDDRQHAVAGTAAHDGPHVGHVQAALA
jgi:DNA-binding transcriptional LysR family regulator